MTLDDLLKIEGITNYNIWWYGMGLENQYFDEKGMRKRGPLEIYKGADAESGRIYLCFQGITGSKCKYKCAIKLTEKTDDNKYNWEPVNIGLDMYANRLIVKCKHKFSFYNSNGSDFEVDQIYANEGERSIPYFHSYDAVDLSFSQLKEIVDNEYSDYYQHLSCVKAVYMIIDGNTGKQYVGSAYDNNESLWARWKTYANTYHGGNISFIELYETKGPEYFEKFKYIILQIYPMTISNKEIIEEETKYKNRFLSREFGWNNN